MRTVPLTSTPLSFVAKHLVKRDGSVEGSDALGGLDGTLSERLGNHHEISIGVLHKNLPLAALPIARQTP